MAGELSARGELPVLDLGVVRALLESEVRPAGGGALAGRKRGQELQLFALAPALAVPPERVPAGALAGLWRAYPLEDGRLRLVAPLGLGRPVDVVPVPRLTQGDAERFDLLWGAGLTAPREEPPARLSERDLDPRPSRPYGVWLSQAADGADRLTAEHQRTLSAGRWRAPAALAGRPRSWTRSADLALQCDGTVDLYVAQPALRELADDLARALRDQGVEVTVRSKLPPSDAPGLFLHTASGLGAQGTLLAAYDSLLHRGRLLPGAALDAQGYLLWPPPVRAPNAGRLVPPPPFPPR